MNILSITFFTSFIFAAECSLNETSETRTPTTKPTSTTDTRYRNIQILTKKYLRKNLITTLNSVNIKNGFNFIFTEEDQDEYLSYMHRKMYQKVDGHVDQSNLKHASVKKIVFDYLTSLNDEQKEFEETNSGNNSDSESSDHDHSLNHAENSKVQLKNEPSSTFGEPIPSFHETFEHSKKVIQFDELKEQLKLKYPNLFRETIVEEYNEV